MRRKALLALAFVVFPVVALLPARAGAQGEGKDKDKDKDAPPPAAAEASAPPAGSAGGSSGVSSGGPSIDLAKLRADYDRLRDDLFRARARATIAQEGLYPSKLAATLRWQGAPDYVVRRAELRLDGASIWDSGGRPLNDELARVAERPVKPGPHALTLRLDVRPSAAAKKAGGDADQLGYVSEHTFAVVVSTARLTTVEITGDEDGDPPDYEPELEVEIQTEK